MRIENPSLVRAFGLPGRCEYCGTGCDMRECAHVFAKGHGAGSQLDIAINIVSVGRGAWYDGWERCQCHRQHHAGNEPTQKELLAVACARENVLQRDAIAVIYLLLRLPKDARPWQLEQAMDESVVDGESGTCVGMNLAQRALVAKILSTKGTS